MKTKLLLAATIFTLLSLSLKAQQTDPNISPYWENYYRQYPTEIEEKYQGIDFIQVIEEVNFQPKSSLLQNQTILKKGLLIFSQEALRQMSIDGWYYSMTKKHDDYFTLYNLTYQPISKETWNRLCPFLIPLMSIDSTIKLNN
jgi:hypothetical protein